MRKLLVAWTVVGTLAWVTPSVFAQARPKDATARCKDGTYSTATTRQGACSGHGGIATWYADEKEKTPSTKSGSTTTRATSTSTKATSTSTTTTAKPVTTQATGRCQDGTETTARTKRGACSAHGGLKTWYADAASTAPAAPAAPRSTTSSTPATTTSAPRSTTSSGSTTTTTPRSPAPTPTTAPSTRAQIVTPPANAPANATAQCNDGTFSFAKQHRGACSSHKGVKEWYK